jgi:hypothetical protein
MRTVSEAIADLPDTHVSAAVGQHVNEDRESSAIKPIVNFVKEATALASLSEAKSMAAEQPCQGDPDGLRFAPA